MMNELQRLMNALKYSFNGLKVAIKEPAFRTELVLFPLIIWGALSLGNNNIEVLLMIGSWIIVLIVEILNTSIEAVVDRIGTEHHTLSGVAKDLGSVAVLISVMLAIVTWTVIIFL
ncbi:MAG: diacylglycerol kinase [Mariprofundaceae bacterium]